MKVLCLLNSTVHPHIPLYTKVSVFVMCLLTKTIYCLLAVFTYE